MKYQETSYVDHLIHLVSYVYEEAAVGEAGSFLSLVLLDKGPVGDGTMGRAMDLSQSSHSSGASAEQEKVLLHHSCAEVRVMHLLGGSFEWELVKELLSGSCALVMVTEPLNGSCA